MDIEKFISENTNLGGSVVAVTYSKERLIKLFNTYETMSKQGDYKETFKTPVQWLEEKIWLLDNENFTVPQTLVEQIEEAKKMEKDFYLGTNQSKKVSI